MTNIVYFHTEATAVDMFLRSSKAKADFKAGVDRMQATIDDPSKSDRTKIESKMIKAILEFDDHEFERTSNILKRMDMVGLKVVEVKK